MVRPFLFLFIYMSAYVCLDIKDRNGPGTPAINKSVKPAILWTTDISADGKFYAIGGDDGLLRIFEATGFKLLKSYKLKGAIQCIDWHKKGKILAIALDDNPVQLLTIETGQFAEIKGTHGSRALAWNFNGELLAVGDYEGVLQIRDKSGNLIRSISKENTKTYLGVDWHPKKNILATGSDKIRLFDTAGNILQNIRHRLEETIVLTVKWHPNGAFFASGDYGHKEEGIESLLQFWKEDGTNIKTLRGSKAEYRNIRWNKTGTLLATASDALRLWNKDGQLVYTGKSRNLLWGIDWDNKTHNIVTTSEKGDINLWSSKARLKKVIF